MVPSKKKICFTVYLTFDGDAINKTLAKEWLCLSLFFLSTGCISCGCGYDVPQQHDVLIRWVRQDYFKEHSHCRVPRSWHCIFGIPSLNADENGIFFAFLVIFVRENWIPVSMEILYVGWFIFFMGLVFKVKSGKYLKSLLR